MAHLLNISHYVEGTTEHVPAKACGMRNLGELANINLP